MNWFSNLFKKENKNSTIQPDEPWPRATAPGTYRRGDSTYTVVDISEPVFAIVECMKKYPSRFKARYIDEPELNRRVYKIVDVKTNQKLEIVHGWSWGG